MASLTAKCQRKKDKINRLRGITATFEVRRLLQKWKLSSAITRYAEQLSRKFLDKENFKTYILQDIRAIFHGPEVIRMHNSIELYKERLEDLQSQNKEI